MRKLSIFSHAKAADKDFSEKFTFRSNKQAALRATNLLSSKMRRFDTWVERHAGAQARMMSKRVYAGLWTLAFKPVNFESDRRHANRSLARRAGDFGDSEIRIRDRRPETPRHGPLSVVSNLRARESLRTVGLSAGSGKVSE